MLVLSSQDSDYRIISEVSITRPPIRVLNTRTNGWHDLGVVVQGGGILNAYESKLSFDGTSYPDNPTVPPAQPLKHTAAGKVVISGTEDAVPLFGR